MKKNKEKKNKRRYWYWILIVAAAIALGFVFLLFHRPADYEPADIVDSNQISEYLTHDLLPQLYNGTQRQEPFDVVITQIGVNEIIVQSKWIKELPSSGFSSLQVFFRPDAVVLMATAAADGAEFIITAELRTKIDNRGLLALEVTKVKVGALNITSVAMNFAQKMYADRIAREPVKDDWRAKIAACLLNGQGFEPVFNIDDEKVRIEKITVVNAKLIIHLVPAV